MHVASDIRHMNLHGKVARSPLNRYSLGTTHPICSSHEDAFWAVDVNVSPSKPPQGGFAVS